jgi:menaquinone-dependent protoporphyrinogen oxidase
VVHFLVTYASKHGSTQEVLERIASRLKQLGVPAELRPMNQVDGLDGYDGVVIGSAIYIVRWMKQATDFVERVRPALAGCRVWLFSSGPLGDEAGLEPPQIAELRTSLSVIEHRLFAGALHKERLSLAERALVKGVTAPYGDFRPWSEIDSWTGSIATSIKDAVSIEPVALHVR